MRGPFKSHEALQRCLKTFVVLRCWFLKAFLCARRPVGVNHCAALLPGPAGNSGLRSFSPLYQRPALPLGSVSHRSRISSLDTSFFKHGVGASQRLMRGHLLGRMKTWQQSKLEGLALFSYQRDPQPARLSLDFCVEIRLRGSVSGSESRQATKFEK